jgi:Cu2+-exporting ATPase
MKTSVIEVHDMLSVLSVDEVEKRISEVQGVESVTVNFAAANATVRYDETQLEIGDVKSTVRQHGYEPAEPATPVPAASKAAQAPPDAPDPPAGKAPPEKAESSASPESSPAGKAAAPASVSDASKRPAASAAPDEQPDKTTPEKG